MKFQERVELILIVLGLAAAPLAALYLMFRLIGVLLGAA